MNHSVVAIIPSAGMGKRFGGSVKKTYVYLGSTPVVIHTLLKFEASPKINEIIPVVAAEDRQYLSDLLSQFHLTKVTRVVNGGKKRQDSIANALNQLRKADLVFIHDGVRPFVSCKLIDRLIEAVQGVDGVIPAVAIRDTVKERSHSGFVIKTIDREQLVAVQTPQVFLWPVLKRAYETAYAEGYYGTDDASLVERIGGQVKVIEGEYFNVKITTPEDMILGEFILDRESKRCELAQGTIPTD
jgi:2-C-methyl-D-erythritol 4-phosphate cytidylyltransferase